MIRRGELNSNIEWAVAEIMETGEKINLQTIGDSYCHFFQNFCLGDDEITLRLDWSDRDKHGHPTLDADFKDKNTGKMRNHKGDRKGAHHTQTKEKGHRIYCWEFRDYKQKFRVTIGWLLDITVASGENCSASLTVNNSTDEQFLEDIKKSM